LFAIETASAAATKASSFIRQQSLLSFNRVLLPTYVGLLSQFALLPGPAIAHTRR